MTRAELARRVAERLRADGTAETVIELVLRPGFFPQPDGLLTLAKQWHLVAPDTTIDE